MNVIIIKPTFTLLNKKKSDMICFVHLKKTYGPCGRGECIKFLLEFDLISKNQNIKFNK